MLCAGIVVCLVFTYYYCYFYFFTFSSCQTPVLVSVVINGHASAQLISIRKEYISLVKCLSTCRDVYFYRFYFILAFSFFSFSDCCYSFWFWSSSKLLKKTSKTVNMQSEEKYQGAARPQNKGGDYHYHSKPPGYASGVERGRGYGRQIGLPGRGLNFRSNNYNLAPPSAPQQRQYCKFFSEGRCKFGANCHNIHDASFQPQSVTPSLEPCKFYARGHCKYGESCRNAHTQEHRNNGEQN